MSWRFAAPVIWTCDGCGQRMHGWAGIVPDGWTTIPGHRSATIAGKVVRPDKHYCSACSVPQEQERT